MPLSATMMSYLHESDGVTYHFNTLDSSTSKKVSHRRSWSVNKLDPVYLFSDLGFSNVLLLAIEKCHTTRASGSKTFFGSRRRSHSKSLFAPYTDQTRNRSVVSVSIPFCTLNDAKRLLGRFT